MKKRFLRLSVCWAVLNTAVLAFAAETNVALAITASWRYTTNNLDGVSWTNSGYNDSTWFGPSNALFYIEPDSIPATKNTPLPSKPPGFTLPYNTYYFRTTFQVTNPPDVTLLIFSNLVDDGAVFYLNGVEIQRLYMAAGAVVYSTTSTNHEATSYDVFTISGNLLTNLLTGSNTLAVEVHQTSSSSSDVVFGSALSVVTDTNTGGLFFDGVNDYVTFGSSSTLNVSNFTVECWFKRQGAGATASTGTGGVTAYPLVTRGRGEADGDNRDCNFFLGFNTSGLLVADFEDFHSGLNHPVTGTTTLTSNSWQHAAVTYDVNSGTWVLYLNGIANATNVIVNATNAVRTPRYDSIQHAALATALTSVGAASGFFSGTLDEVRIWNYARSTDQIATNYYAQITNATGLVARWSLDNGNATNSVAGGVNGTLANGAVKAAGYPFTAPASLAAIALTRGPYLQMSTPTSIIIRWRTDFASDSRVIYGTNLATPDLTNTVSAFVGEHIVTLTNLQPDTKYFYTIGSTTTNLAVASTNQFFLTHPLPGSVKPMRVWVIGDAGTATASQTAVYTNFNNFNGTNLVHAWLQLGDNAYDDGTDAEYQTAVFNMYSNLLRRSVTWPTLGNHDTAQATTYVDSYPYFNIFSLPTAGEAGGVASGTEHYYSFDIGMAHFICLDSMTADRSTNGAMLTWLQSDLAVTTNRWIIAFWHHPPYTKGSHNSDTETQLISVRQNFLPILEAGGVDLILTGHSHSYERSFLLNGHYGLSSTLNTNTMIVQTGGGSGAGAYLKHDTLGYAAQGNGGTVYAVAGSSGQTSGGSLNHPAMYYDTNALGSMVLDFTSNRLDIIFLREIKLTNDTFTLIKDNQPPVANVASYVRNRGASLKFSRSDLLATYTSDPDGDPCSLAAVGTSPNASIFTNSTIIYYSPNNPDSTSDDTFGYVVSDGLGGSASNYILITVTNSYGSNNIVSLQTGVPGPNSNTIKFVGIPGYEYVVQYATNLPGNPWNNLATNTVSTNGFWIIVDPDATNASRFYRSKY